MIRDREEGFRKPPYRFSNERYEIESTAWQTESGNIRNLLKEQE